MTEIIERFINAFANALILIAVFYVSYTLIPSTEVHPEFVETYAEFNQLIKENCKSPPRNPNVISIGFDENLGPEILGECRTFFNMSRIRIDPLWWAIVSKEDQYQVLMHELTHCFLGHFGLAGYPRHTDDTSSYMYYAFSKSYKIPETRRQVVDAIKERCGTK